MGAFQGGIGSLHSMGNEDGVSQEDGHGHFENDDDRCGFGDYGGAA